MCTVPNSCRPRTGTAKSTGRMPLFYPKGAVRVQAQFQQGRLVSTVSVRTQKGRLVAEELPDATGKWSITRITYDKAGRPKRSETLDITRSIYGPGEAPPILGGQR